LAGETEVFREYLPQRHFFHHKIPHDQTRARTPDRSGGKPATNRLSYGAAFVDYYIMEINDHFIFGELIPQYRAPRYGLFNLEYKNTFFDPSCPHVAPLNTSSFPARNITFCM
jgi:hypothetical protein